MRSIDQCEIEFGRNFYKYTEVIRVEWSGTMQNPIEL